MRAQKFKISRAYSLLLANLVIPTGTESKSVVTAYGLKGRTTGIISFLASCILTPLSNHGRALKFVPLPGCIPAHTETDRCCFQVANGGVGILIAGKELGLQP